jgi:hypothetical protein
MSLLDRKPRCDCCPDLPAYIRTHLDSDDTIDNSEDPVEVVELLDSVSEGGRCGVTATEMAEYIAELSFREWQIDSAD